MLSFFRQSFRQWARSGTRTGARPQPVRRLECEPLEDRLLPSLTGANFLVNTTKTRLQNQPSVASSLTTGCYVVVWTDHKATNDPNIKAQRYDAGGHKIGKEITVEGSRQIDHDPVVAMDAHGNFVVVWTRDFYASDTDLWAVRYRADGTRLSSPFRVATNYKAEFDPSVAMAGNGDFIVGYTLRFNGSDTDVYAKMFKANGTLARTISVAASTRPEGQSSVAATADGRFDIACTDSNNIILQRFSKYGVRLGSVAVAKTTRTERAPSVALDGNGNAVVAWQVQVGSNWNVQARRVSSSGVLGSVITVQATAAQETGPSVSIDPTTRRFVVAYQSVTGSTKAVKVTELSAAGSVVRTATMGTNLTGPAVAVGANHTYLVAANSILGNSLDPDGGIFGRRGLL